MQELEHRIVALRQLLDGETPVSSPSHASEGELFGGHTPAHAAPGPLLDELRGPESVVNLHELRADRKHRPAHSAEGHEAPGFESDEVIRLQA